MPEHEHDEMPRNELAFDPDYWENMAEQRRNQASMVSDHPRFYGTLSRQAEELDRLAQLAFKNRQERNRMGRVLPTYRASGEKVVPISPAIRTQESG